MDEVERRVTAHELALIEVVAHVERSHIMEAMKVIRDGLYIEITDEERAVRLAALDLLDDAAHRHDPAGLGMFLQRRGLR